VIRNRPPMTGKSVATLFRRTSRSGCRRARSASVKSVVVASGALLLIGCNGGTTQADRAQFLDAPKMERTLGASGLRHSTADAAWPNEEWWRRFKNGELDRLVNKAVADNQNLQKARDTLIEAEGGVQVASARLLPSLQSDYWTRQSRNPNHGVVYSYNNGQGGREKTSAFLTPFVMTWELDFWGKNQATMEAALGQAAAQEAEMEQTRLLLITGVCRAYLRGYALARQLEITNELIRLRREYMALAETRYQTGLETADVVQIARGDYEASVRREATVRAALAIQKNAIARMIGAGPDATFALFESKKIVTPQQPALPRRLPIELLVHRPDLAAALHRAEAASERIHVAKTLLLPSLDLSLAAGLEASVTSTSVNALPGYLMNPGATGFAVVPGFHLPIFQAGRLSGGLEVRRAEYDQAVDSYNETLLQAAQQVADALANLKRANAEYDAQMQLVKTASAQLELAQTRLRDGLKDRREIIQERMDFQEASFARQVLEGDRLVASVDLFQALGGGYTDTGPAKPKPTPENDPITPVVDQITQVTGG
jgi:NodT family efflux transporter outer membrane factor (OMF) lipoprotein